MQPQENPARVLLGLHGDCTEGFFLKNLYCLECSRPIDVQRPLAFVSRQHCCSKSYFVGFRMSSSMNTPLS